MKLVIPAILLCSGYTGYAQQQPAADTSTKQKQLKEVSITAKKDAIEIAPGKMILNVQSLATTAGKSALDLLRGVPGITVNGRGNISMTGKDGVLVTIDGRQTYLSGEELRDYLQGITADEIAQVEVMTQPPAQYDAEGNSGVINLKTRKLKKQGLNGNATLTWTKSLFESTHNTILLNYRKGKTNWYTSLNNVNGMNGVWWNEDTYFKDPAGNTLSQTKLRSAPVEWFDKYNLRLGADCNYSENTSGGFSITGAYYANRMHSPIGIDYHEPSSTVTSTRNTYEHSLRRNATGNAYLKHSFSKQSELNINLDYLLYTKRLYQFLATKASKDGVTLPDQLTLRSRVPINIAVYSARADHSITFSNGLKLESGLKHSYVTVDNAAYFMQYASGNWSDDDSRTNRFLYYENISALYANITKKLSPKWDAQIGLRGELANINAVQEATGERINRHLPALFPTAYLAYKADSSNNFELNYGKRVERPQYGQLNPFNYYTFYNTYQRGNPELLPQYAHNVELKHSYKKHWITSLQLSLTTNTMANLTLPDYTTQSTYGIPVNFGNSLWNTLTFMYNNKLTKWWECSASISGRYGSFKGRYNNISVQNDGWNYSAWCSHQFTFGKWQSDCYLQYASSMTGSAVTQQAPVFYSNLGVSRRFLRDTTTVNISIDDPFYIYQNAYYTTQPGLADNSMLRSNSRYCTLVVTYKFGQNNERHEQKRTDEAGRVGI